MPKPRTEKGSSDSSTSLARRVVELREHLENVERDKARLGGMAEQILQRLREEHGCSSLKDAEKKLARLDREAAKLAEEFEQAMEKFQAEWGDNLEEER